MLKGSYARQVKPHFLRAGFFPQTPQSFSAEDIPADKTPRKIGKIGTGLFLDK